MPQFPVLGQGKVFLLKPVLSISSVMAYPSTLCCAPGVSGVLALVFIFLLCLTYSLYDFFFSVKTRAVVSVSLPLL